MHPTLYGVLAFGKVPQSYPQTHNFRVECVAYEGDDRASDVLQVAEAAGRLDEQVRRAIGWFASLGRFESYRGLVREDRPLLPQPALRESLVNAVVHRDYAITGSKVLLEVFARHVDVTSPGGLPNHMSAESVRAGGHPRSRNELMANFMLGLGFMEQRGRGWPVMRRAMREFNGTEPEIMQGDASKFVRLRFRLDSRNSNQGDGRGVKDIFPDLDLWQSQGEEIALATLVNVKRSAPRPPGARLCVTRSGTHVRLGERWLCRGRRLRTGDPNSR